jgi:tetratricopeptide (TPR) repeat protein
VNATRNLSRNREWLANAQRAAGVWLLFAAIGCAFGGTRPDLAGREDEFRQRVKLEFETARERYRSDTNNAVAAWQFGRAAFDLAEFARTKSERESVAKQGVSACRRAAQLTPKSAPAHYYLALNLGQLARVYLLKGLSIVSEMEKAFVTARELDPLFDYAGSDRALGLLYHQAPGWPISLGNQSKAKRHLDQAVRLRPNYPGNRIALARFLWETRQPRSFTREWNALVDLLPAAREEFTGRDWELSWIEWDHRLDQLRSHAESMVD